MPSSCFLGLSTVTAKRSVCLRAAHWSALALSALLVACGGGGSSGSYSSTTSPSSSGSGTTTPPPTSLSYASPPPPFVVGVSSLSLKPTVSGTVSQFSITPALPVGLVIDASTGVISGTPSETAASAAYTVTASNASGSTTATVTLAVNAGPIIALSATATSSGGGTITYYWKVTDGQLVTPGGATNPTPANPTWSSSEASGASAQASWMLPQGQGLHFAYVLVADGSGNCSEARLVISSDNIGATTVANPLVVPNKAFYEGIGCTALTDPFFNVSATAPPASPQTPPAITTISSMSATYNGASIGAVQGVYPSSIGFDAPSSQAPEPSNVYQASGWFLEPPHGSAAQNTVQNTAQDACAYYLAGC